MFVLVYGERVEVPDDCIIVCAGPWMDGDLYATFDGNNRFQLWANVMAEEGLDGDTSDMELVIRRDPGAEG